jgi:hypothetical protein
VERAAQSACEQQREDVRRVGDAQREERGESERGDRMVSNVFENTAAEMRALIESGDAEDTLEREGILTYVEVRLTKKQAEDLRERLRATIEELAAGEEEKGPGLRRYRLTLAYFPLAPRRD